MENVDPKVVAHREANKRWKDKDPEAVRRKQREANKRWREKNPEKYKECYTKQNKLQYAKEKEAGFPKHKEYRQRNAAAIKARMKIWCADNREYLNAYKMRNYYKLKYGLTPEGKTAMLEAQGGVCACCGSPSPNHKQGWVVDHCHDTGKVRGILCQPCNLALGKVKDSTNHLRALITYLEKHNADD